MSVGACKKGVTWMSAFGPKQTLAVALHESAFGGKADMTIAACLLFWSLLGVKRTWRVAAHMSAYDPKRTSDRCSDSANTTALMGNLFA